MAVWAISLDQACLELGWNGTFFDCQKIQGEKMASLGWVSLGLASRACEDRGFLSRASSQQLALCARRCRVLRSLVSPALPAGPPRPGDGSFGACLLYEPLDSQSFQGSRGQPALTVTRESWDGGRGVGQGIVGLSQEPGIRARSEGGRLRCEGL